MAVKKIYVLSQDEAEEWASYTTAPFATISITNRGQRAVDFADTPANCGILRLKFDDEYFPEGGGPKAKDFGGLKEFVDQIREQTDILMIHCAAGLSRSPALALAIVEYWDEDISILESPSADPNPLVYRLAKEALGLGD